MFFSSRIRDACASELALGLAHPHYILLIHSMLWEMGANMELAMPRGAKPVRTGSNIRRPGLRRLLSNRSVRSLPLFRVRPEIQDVCRFGLAMGGRARSGGRRALLNFTS